MEYRLGEHIGTESRELEQEIIELLEVYCEVDND